MHLYPFSYWLERDVWSLWPPRWLRAFWATVMSDAVRSAWALHFSGRELSAPPTIVSQTLRGFFCVLSRLSLTWQQSAVRNNRAITKICISTLFYAFLFHFKRIVLSPLCHTSNAKRGLCETPWMQHHYYLLFMVCCIHWQVEAMQQDYCHLLWCIKGKTRLNNN